VEGNLLLPQTLAAATGNPVAAWLPASPLALGAPASSSCSSRSSSSILLASLQTARRLKCLGLLGCLTPAVCTWVASTGTFDAFQPTSAGPRPRRLRSALALVATQCRGQNVCLSPAWCPVHPACPPPILVPHLLLPCQVLLDLTPEELHILDVYEAEEYYRQVIRAAGNDERQSTMYVTSDPIVLPCPS